MKVGVIGPTTPDTFADNIIHALRSKGVRAVSLGSASAGQGRLRNVMGVAQRLTAETEALFQRPLVKAAREAECDFIISVEQRLMPQIVEALNSCTNGTALWYPDHLSNLGRLTLVESPYSAVFVKDESLCDRLRDVYGLACHYMPEGCTPEWHSSSLQWGTNPHIAVVGNLYPTRTRLLRRLTQDGVPIRLYGPPFPRWSNTRDLAALHSGLPVYKQDKADVFRSARGVLNNLHPAEMDSVNCRLFEATCAGAVVLCEERSSLSSLFSVGEEVLAFDSYDSLLSSCLGLLEGDIDGRSIADAAAKRSQRDHRVEQRVDAILRVLA